MIHINKIGCLLLTALTSFPTLAADFPVHEFGLVSDVTLDAVRIPEYTKVPDVLMGYNIPLGVDLTNVGVVEQSNIVVEVEIYLNSAYLTTISSLYFGPLTAGQSGSLDMGSYQVTALGVYDVIYTATLAGAADENPADNEIIFNNLVEVTTDTMSRDDGEANTGTLSIGSGEPGGYLGNLYEFSTEVTISSIQFIHDNNSCDLGVCDLDGEVLRVDVFKMNATTGLPDDMVGSSEEYVVPVGQAIGTVVDLAFVGNLYLPAGGYVFALEEPELGSAQLHITENRFTPGTAWVDWSTNPFGQWSNIEAFGHNDTYYMRPKFGPNDVIFNDGFEL
jgi:hypothetical protein